MKQYLAQIRLEVHPPNDKSVWNTLTSDQQEEAYEQALDGFDISRTDLYVVNVSIDEHEIEMEVLIGDMEEVEPFDETYGN